MSRARLIIVAEIVGVCAVLLGLSLHYARLFPNLGRDFDLWFGIDIPRVIAWMQDLGAVHRGHLHPLLVPLLKVYGLGLKVLSIHPPHWLLPAFALPFVVLISLAVVGTAHLVARVHDVERSAPAFTATLLSVGSLPIFGAVPESHPIGGAALLLQTAFVLRWLYMSSDDPRRREAIAWGVIVTGLFAGGMTISNLLPALIVATPVLHSWWVRREVRQLRLVALMAVFLAALAVVIALPARALEEFAGTDALFLSWPYPESMARTIHGLVTLQFGAPYPELWTWENPFNGFLVTSIDRQDPGILHFLALALWLAAVVIGWRRSRRSGAYRYFVTLCAMALASQIALHTFYAAWEAYLVSPNAWPYVVMPGIAAVAAAIRARRRAVIALIAGAVLLAGLQSTLAISSLSDIAGKPGVVRER